MRNKTRVIAMMSVLMTALSSSPALAGLSDCQDLYIGRIWVERGVGLKAVVFLANPADGGGSYWSYFDNWTSDEKKSALALLEAAKLAGHRVHVATDNTDGCGLTQGGTQAKAVFLANNY